MRSGAREDFVPWGLPACTCLRRMCMCAHAYAGGRARVRVVRRATQAITVLFNMKPSLLARIAAYVLLRTAESFRRRLGTLS